MNLKTPVRYIKKLTIDLLRGLNGNTFTFDGENYRYFSSMTSLAYQNERSVEIPIAFGYIKRYAPLKNKILEVGNTMSNYIPLNYDIIDKYEEADWLIQTDILDFNPPYKYDFIICISTLEHIGWDAPENKDSKKTVQTVNKFRSLLNEGGIAIATFPIGYNEFLDDSLCFNELPFDEIRYLKRISWYNSWKEATWDEVRYSKYGHPYGYANAIGIGKVRK